MDASQIVCPHCGTLNEIVGRRTFGDYNPLCINCGEPVREARKIEYVGGNGRLYLQHIPSKGLGVFTRDDVKQSSVVERCPAYVIEVGVNIMGYLRYINLLPYADSNVGQAGNHMFFPWINNKTRALVLGYGMLYNHAPDHASNLAYRPYVDPETNRRYMDFIATRDVEAGSELTFTYAEAENLWFDDKGKRGE